MRKGWICLHRCIQEHWIWQDANRFKWWVDLLLRANNKDAKVLIDGSLVDCKRGQFITSLGKLAEEWMVSRDTVRRFLDALESDTMIARKSTHKMTQITICNYDTYQDVPTSDNTTDRQLTQQQTDTNNNVDSITTSSNTSTNSNREGGKKTQAKFIPPTLEEVIAYYKEKGFVKTNPEAFFHHYNTVGWMVNKNKMKCWKSALAKWEAREYDNKPKQSNQSNPNKAQYRNPQAVYSSESDI
jgi:hypothetical protein